MSTRIYSWNVNGIRAVIKKGSLESFLVEHDPDILCLQETKATRDQVEIDLPNYQEYWCSASRKGYAGTAIFSKKPAISHLCGLPDDIVEQYELGDTYGHLNEEGRVIVVEFDEYFVVSVYTPNAKDDLTRLPIRTVWDHAFLTYMKRLDKEKPVVFCGDLNVAHSEIDLAHPKANEERKGFTKEERAGIDAMLRSEFEDTFRIFTKEGGNYTWWSHFANARARNIGWRIDYIFTSHRIHSHIQKASIHPDIQGSDHCPVSVTLKDI